MGSEVTQICAHFKGLFFGGLNFVVLVEPLKIPIIFFEAFYAFLHIWTVSLHTGLPVRPSAHSHIPFFQPSNRSGPNLSFSDNFWLPKLGIPHFFNPRLA